MFRRLVPTSVTAHECRESSQSVRSATAKSIVNMYGPVSVTNLERHRQVWRHICQAPVCRRLVPTFVAAHERWESTQPVRTRVRSAKAKSIVNMYGPVRVTNLEHHRQVWHHICQVLVCLFVTASYFSYSDGSFTPIGPFSTLWRLGPFL